MALSLELEGAEGVAILGLIVLIGYALYKGGGALWGGLGTAANGLGNAVSSAASSASSAASGAWASVTGGAGTINTAPPSSSNLPSPYSPATIDSGAWDNYTFSDGSTVASLRAMGVSDTEISALLTGAQGSW